MKLIHLSDLHLGKRVNELSMLDDQKYILKKIIEVTDSEKPDAVIIAGDIYDKSVPPAEAVSLFDDFLYELSLRRLKTFVISGNHDSPERIAFGNRLMNLSGIYMSPVYNGSTVPVRLKDEYGELNIFMLPFIRPSNVREFFPDSNISSYTDAVRIAVNNMNVDKSERNIIITHQLVTGAVRSDSEDISVGGIDNVDSAVFDIFDYTALGHIHRPQRIGRDTIRYCGTPLKYSFSEANHKKSVTVVELLEKGNVKVNELPLSARHDMREIKGSYMELTEKSNYYGTETHDYLHITLTDEEIIPNALGKLRVIYPNLMKLDYDNTRTRNTASLKSTDNTVNKSPTELLKEFYYKQNGRSMNDNQLEFVEELIKKVWEGEK